MQSKERENQKAADSGYGKISSSSSYAGIQIALELDHLLFPVFV
jgi:hypothetical protein